MALIVVDASVLIAHFESGDALHGAATAALDAHDLDDLRLPASAYAEALVTHSRSETVAAARRAVAALGLEIVPIDEAVAEAAAGLRARVPAIRLPDALVLGCAEALRADVVLTGDRRWKDFPRVQLV